MRILFLGDVFGRTGRAAISAHLPSLRMAWSVDVVVANCENATQGRGINANHARSLLKCGIDCMTLGDHSFDQRDITGIMENLPIVRPINFARKAPGRGTALLETPKGRVLVISALGQVFMKHNFDSAIPQLQQILGKYPLGRSVAAIVLDFHCEATSEKNAAGFIHDGLVTLVAGTHTHIPTNDARILPNGTAFITDAGMCGVYDSVIGMDKAVIIERFMHGIPYGKMFPASGTATLSGMLVDSDDRTGLATRIRQVKIGGPLGRPPPVDIEDPFDPVPD